jgi:Ring finger domain
MSSACRYSHSAASEATSSIITSHIPGKSPKPEACPFLNNGECFLSSMYAYSHSSRPSVKPPQPTEAVENTCSICFEISTTFGLLSDCKHIFCYDCLLLWRNPDQKTGPKAASHHLRCPVCRIPCSDLIQSTRICSTVEKRQIIEQTRLRLNKDRISEHLSQTRLNLRNSKLIQCPRILRGKCLLGTDCI